MRLYLALILVAGGVWGCLGMIIWGGQFGVFEFSQTHPARWLFYIVGLFGGLWGLWIIYDACGRVQRRARGSWS